MTPETKDTLLFPRTYLAEGILATIESRLQNAATIFAPRRKGKTTFLINDLIPIAKAHGFIVATADLWFDKAHPERVIAGGLDESILGAGFLRRNWHEAHAAWLTLAVGGGRRQYRRRNDEGRAGEEGGLNLIELFSASADSETARRC